MFEDLTAIVRSTSLWVVTPFILAEDSQWFGEIHLLRFQGLKVRKARRRQTAGFCLAFCSTLYVMVICSSEKSMELRGVTIQWCSFYMPCCNVCRNLLQSRLITCSFTQELVFVESSKYQSTDIMRLLYSLAFFRPQRKAAIKCFTLLIHIPETPCSNLCPRTATLTWFSWILWIPPRKFRTNALK